MGRGGAAFPDRSQMGRGRQAVGASALSDLQCRRVRAGHVQGSRAARRRSVRDRRSDDDRRIRDRLRARLPLHPRRISARRRAHSARDRRSRARTASSATDILGRGVRSTSRFGAAPARTSAAKRRRSSIRSKAIAASRATSRRFPRRPGLFGLPTVVNNVETLANIPSIVLNGGAAFAKIGTEQSTGTKLFCVSGNVARPGVYEVPFGKTLRDLSTWPAASPNGRSLQAILLGGAAGVFVGPERARHPAHVRGRARREGDAGLGRHRRVRRHASICSEILLRIASFFRDESCGQCVPCRVGTVRQEEALYRIASGKTLGGVPQEVALLDEVGLGDERRVDLRTRTDGVCGDRVGDPSRGRAQGSGSQ